MRTPAVNNIHRLKISAVGLSTNTIAEAPKLISTTLVSLALKYYQHIAALTFFLDLNVGIMAQYKGDDIIPGN